MEEGMVYRPYFDPDFDSLIERINPPRVSIDNQTCRDCTLVKVDSANKHGILLVMVQVLTDLDLLILKSYICSDGGWFMDVFHVTDHGGNKIVDESSLTLYIHQALCTSRKTKELQTCHLGREVKPEHVFMNHTALEMTGTDRPGLLSEISAVLSFMGCHVTATIAWTHKSRVACIIYLELENKDDLEGGENVDDPNTRLEYVQEQVEHVVDAHHQIGERRSVRLTLPTHSRIHTERRLHQLLAADGDYEQCCSTSGRGGGGGDGTEVTIEYCRERGYWVVNVRCQDRPKLLFDTVCTLTDMQYVVFHASVGSKGSIANQEYYIRHKDGCTLDTENERRKVSQCLVAAIQRRNSHGWRLDVSAGDRRGLLSEVTRVLRENGLSITRAEVRTRGETAVGSFYVTDASGNNISARTVELVRREIGEKTAVVVVPKSSSGSDNSCPCRSTTTATKTTTRRIEGGEGIIAEEKPGFWLGNLFRARLERLSINFGHII